LNPKKIKRNSIGKILVPGSTVINVGLPVFEEALKQQGVRVIQVQIKPSYKIAQDLKSILDNLI
jgi:hypothetical protein